jgi:hypothetical protein
MIHGCAPRSWPPRSRRSHRPASHPGRSPAPEASPVVEPPFPIGEWDRMCRDYHAANPGVPVPAAIHLDTGILPSAVAEAVCDEAGRWLALPLPVDWIAELAEHAEVVYQHNSRFRRLLRRPGDAGCDWLRKFTRHWLGAILASRRPDLLSRLPASYAVGRVPGSWKATSP